MKEEVRRWLKTEDMLMQQLKRFKHDLGKKINVEKMILFGSRAKGNANRTSDVDILLISKDFTGKKYFRRSPELYMLWDYDCDVDILCLTKEELKKKQGQISIISQAVKEGILI
ncbi:MAG: nucleotidyltransferase domain-containing protein [Candidatus Woesearchaeota archaeon]